MLIKVCGMRWAGNIEALAKLTPDYMGFIFYAPSPRYAGEILTEAITEVIPPEIKKTGVFVNEGEDVIIKTAQRFHLDAVQLHGNETPKLCQRLQSEGLEVLKAINPEKLKNQALLNEYASVCDFFLFDTPTAQHGGSGIKFDWSVLKEYHEKVPYFLSGGIGPDDLDSIESIVGVKPIGLDVNSRFEVEPGLKDIPLLEAFIRKIREKEKRRRSTAKSREAGKETGDKDM